MSNNQAASQITWNQIQKNWFYDDLLLGKYLYKNFKLQNTFFNVKNIIFKKLHIFLTLKNVLQFETFIYYLVKDHHKTNFSEFGSMLFVKLLDC